MIPTSTVTYNGLAADLLAYGISRPAAQPSGITVALHIHSADDTPLTLGDVIPSLSAPFDTLPLPDAAIGFSTLGHIWNVAPEDGSAATPPEVVDFFTPIYFPDETADCADIEDCTGLRTRFNVPQGGFIISAFTLPDSFDGVLDSFGIEKGQPLLLTGTASLFGNSSQFALQAALPPMSPAAASDGDVGFFESGQLSFGLRVNATTAAVEAYIRGQMVVRVEDATETCGYDRLGFLVEAAVEFDTTSVEFSLLGALVPAGPAPAGGCGDPDLVAWSSPLGQEWLNIQGVALQLGVQASPAGVDIKIGFAAGIEIGDTDIQGAFSLAVTPISNPPFIIVKPLGFRIASANGVTFQQLVSFYNTNIAATGAEINLGEWTDFDVAVKNFEFSYAVEDEPALCLFTGIRARGYLYLGSDLVDYTPADASPCIPGNPAALPMPAPGPGTGCAIEENKSHGCFAGIDLSINPGTGFAAHAEIGPITLGPLSIEQTILDVIANATTIQFEFSGGVSIEDVFYGYTEIGVKPDGFHFLSQLTLFPEPPPGLFQAQVAGQASFSLTEPTFELDARVASTLGAEMEPIVRPIAETFATTVKVINGSLVVLNDPTLGFDALIDYILNIPNQLVTINPAYANDPLVILLQGLSTGVQSARATAAALGIPVSIDAIINGVLQGAYIGIPPIYGEYTDFGIFGSGCFIDFNSSSLDCILIPAIGFQIPGLCPTIVNVPNCNAAGLKTLVVNSLNSLLASTLGVDTVTLQANLSRIAANFEARPILFDVACAGFHLSMGAGATTDRSVQLMVKFIVLGTDVVVGPLNWDFDADPATNLSGVLTSLGDSLMGTSPAFACSLTGEADPTIPLVAPPADLAQTGSFTVNEGGALSLSGGFDPGTTQSGDIQTVTINWPGVPAETITVPVGTSTFSSASRTFADDNPSATPFDEINIPVTVVNSRTGSASATFRVRINNVTPVFSNLSVAPAETNEGSSLALTGTFTDPGTQDTYTGRVQWGDGTEQSFTVAAPTRTFSLTHTYKDDPKAANDTYAIAVSLRDDDSGTVNGNTSAVVRNVAPSIDADSIVINLLSPDGTEVVEADVDSLNESDLFEIAGTFSDPGTADTHVLEIDLGDGATPLQLNVVPGSEPSASRSFSAIGRFPDDNPTASAFDLAALKLRVTDDDGGVSAQVTKEVTVYNVNPSVVIETATIDENQTASATFTITDVSPEDTFTLDVEWADGRSESVEVAADARIVTLTHQYLDDNPTATSSDIYVIEALVTDDDTGTGSADVDLRVNNTAPRLASASSPVSVQYSDSMPSPLTVVLDDVAADTLVATTTYTFDGGDPIDGLPAELAMTVDGCVPTTADGLPDPRQACSWSISGQAHVAPGVYVITVLVTDDDTGATPVPVTLNVLPEDARVDYIGPTIVSAPSVNDGYIDVELRAVVRDISDVPGIVPPDLEPGVITHANVTFVDRSTGEALCTAPVTTMFAGNTLKGVAACTARFLTEGTPSSWSFDVGSVVGAWYTRDDAADDVGFDVMRPNGNFIHASGFIDAGAPIGSYSPAVGSRVRFDGKNIAFSKNLSRIEADSVVTFTSGGRSYEARVTSVDALGIQRPDGGQDVAQVEARVTLRDITAEKSPVVIGTDLRMQMRFTDSQAPSTPDTFSFALWRADGLLLAGTDWDVVRTTEVVLAGGQVLWKD